jgi:hypothetical protein
MFLRLEKSKYCCNIGVKYVGIFGYADDAILLAPTITSLKLMLQIVNDYATEFCVKFNAEKCQLVVFGESTK